MSTNDRIVRCVSWVAVSSEEQARDNLISLPNQRKGNREFIDSISTRYPGNRGVLIDELQVTDSRNILLFEDAMKAYPAYAKLRQMIDEKAFDLLVAHKWDRIGRTEALVIVIRDLCLQNGIAVVVREAVPSSIDAAVLRYDEGYRISGLVGAWGGAREDREIGRRSREGRTGAAKTGRIYLGKWPYGYEWQYDADGNRSVAIKNAEADVVQRIFDWYINHNYGYNKISDCLYEMGIPSPNKEPRWSIKSVKHIVVRADFYAGIITINKTGEQVEESFRGSHTPIISKDTANLVKEEQRSRNRGRRRAHAIPAACICEYCGKNMVASVGSPTPSDDSDLYRYARCKPCKNNVPVLDVVEALESAIQYIIDTGADALIVPERNSESDRIQSEIAKKNALMSQESRAIDRLLDALESGMITVDKIQDRINTKQQSIARLSQEIKKLREHLEEQEKLGTPKDRVEQIQQAGFEILRQRHSQPLMVRQWLRDHFRIVVGRDIHITVV